MKTHPNINFQQTILLLEALTITSYTINEKFVARKYLHIQYGIDRCGDNLEDHALSDAKNVFCNRLGQIRQSINNECVRKACLQLENW